MKKKTSINYHEPVNANQGIDAKNAPSAPSPNPGMGTIPKGGPTQVPGQPQLNSEKGSS